LIKLKRRIPMRILACKTFMVLAIAAVAAFGADNTLGTWKLNTEKSKYTPAPMPVKNLTVTREAADGGVKVTTSGEQANGTAINSSYSAKFDGKDVQVAGNAPYDTIALKQVDANVFSDSRKKTGGPYKARSRIVVSKDGKTLTSTTRGTNGDGKAFISTFVFEKQ
jgi:hypothetical protein